MIQTINHSFKYKIKCKTINQNSVRLTKKPIQIGSLAYQNLSAIP